MIRIYEDIYKKEVIDLILYIQNIEYKIGINIEEQPDILDIRGNYIKDGGNFWVALNSSGKVIGSIGLQKKTEDIAILKKFFIYKEYRGKEYGLLLYETLLNFSKIKKIKKIVLDSPAIATRAHNFYKKAGFKEIQKESLPILYNYPDRNSLLFILEL